MTVIPEHVRAQLKARFELRLTGPVHLTLYTRPGSSRLILPAGLGCGTCEDARQMAELLRDAAPEKVTLDVVETSRAPGRADANTGRIRFQGLPTGTEFPALIDALERVSRAEHDLNAASLAELAKLTQPTEVMVFATPT